MAQQPYESDQPFWGSTFDLGATGSLGNSPMPAGINPWSVLIVGGNQLPGLFHLKRCRKRHTVDKKKNQGTNSETLSSLGAEAADIHGMLTMWLPIQWDTWRFLAPKILLPPPGKGTPQFYSCYHPSLAAEGITQIYHVSHTTLVVREDGSEFGDIEIFWNEYLPPSNKNASSTPTKQGDITGATSKIPTVYDVQANPSQTEASSPQQKPASQPPPGWTKQVSS